PFDWNELNLMGRNLRSSRNTGRKRSFLWRLCGGHAHVQLVGAKPMHSAESIDRQSNICPRVFGWRDLYQWEGMRSNSAGATGTRQGSTVLRIFAGSPPPP